MSALLRERCQPIEFVEVRICRYCIDPSRHRLRPGGEPGSRRQVLAAPVFSGQESGRQREERQLPEAELTAGGHDLCFDLALKQAPLVLRRDKALETTAARGPVGIGDLPAREVRVSDVPHHAAVHQIRQRLQCFSNRSLRIRLMHLVHVDVIGAQAP